MAVTDDEWRASVERRLQDLEARVRGHRAILEQRHNTTLMAKAEISRRRKAERQARWRAKQQEKTQ